MRAQGEAELAADQGEAQYDVKVWATPHRIATNQLILLPDPARRGLINLAKNVIAPSNLFDVGGQEPREAREAGRSVASRSIPMPRYGRGLKDPPVEWRCTSWRMCTTQPGSSEGPATTVPTVRRMLALTFEDCKSGVDPP
jgi:hypothetical protein